MCQARTWVRFKSGSAEAASPEAMELMPKVALPVRCPLVAGDGEKWGLVVVAGKGVVVGSSNDGHRIIVMVSKTQSLGEHMALAEDMNVVLGSHVLWLTTTCNFSSRAPNILF